MTVRVAIADDHAIVREGLKALLAATDGFDLIAEAGTGSEAVRCAVVDKPDVLVLDIHLPDTSGIAVLHELRRVAPDVAVLMLTMDDAHPTVAAAMTAGAHGYLLKGADPDDVLRALAAVAHGHTILSPGLTSHLLTGRSGGAPSDQPPFSTLTPREREILGLIATGLGNATIAAHLGLSPSTVGNHVTSIFAKMHVTTRAEAIVQARDAGLGSPAETT
jgi:DNA-binding NarL/FixJ family response regulator